MMAPTRLCLRCERHAPTTRNKNDHHRPDSVPPFASHDPSMTPSKCPIPHPHPRRPRPRAPDASRIARRRGMATTMTTTTMTTTTMATTRWTTRGADARGASAADDARAAEKTGRCEGLVATRMSD